MPGRVPRINRRELFGLAAGAAVAAGLPDAAAAEPRGEWLAGDLHCHTVLSHDVWAGPGDDNTEVGDAYTLGWTAGEQIGIAESRRLDFLAITDHDRVDALRLPEYRSARLTLLPAYEHSLAGGHSGVLVPDRARLGDIVRDADGSKSFQGDAGAARFLDGVHALGGIAVLNHPFYGNRDQGAEIAWSYGLDVSARFDAVEVWNIAWPARHDTIPFADSDNYLSLPWWEREILPRRRVGIVGGSDNHWRSTTAIQGVGQPTTWVFARNRSPAAILDAIRSGRTFVAAEPPGLDGPRLLLTAREDWPGGRRAMVGDELRGNGPLAVQVRVANGTGSRLRLVSGGAVLAEEPVVAPDEVHRFRVSLSSPAALRAELYLDRNYFMTALTSPIYTASSAPARYRTTPTDGPLATYGHPVQARERPSPAARKRRQAGCAC